MGCADSPYIRGVGRGVGHPTSVLSGSVASYLVYADVRLHTPMTHKNAAADRFVYVERKVHAEKWTGARSKKVRFKLERSLLPQYMLGRLDARAVFGRMIEEGTLEMEAFEEAVQLAEDCARQIVTLQLVPKIRTMYHRTAFQHKDNDDIRLTLDSPLLLFKEGVVELELQSLERFWSSVVQPINKEAMRPFDYGVLEVKVAGDELPGWTESVLANGRGIWPAPKFSKFQHAIASSFPSEIKILPYWIDGMAPQDGNLSPTMLIDYPGHHPGLEQQPQQQNTSVLKKAVLGFQAGDAYTDVQGGGGTELATSSSYNAALVATATTATTSNYALPAKSVGGGGGGGSGPSQGHLPIQPPQALPRLQAIAKIEPKTFFANERTYIQWLSAAILLVTLSGSMMTTNSAGRIVGTILWPVGFLLILYALSIYHWRLKRLLARDGSSFDGTYANPFAKSPLLHCIVLTECALAQVHAHLCVSYFVRACVCTYI